MTFRSFLVNALDPGRERSLQVPIRDPSADCRKAEDDVNACKLESRPVRHVVTNKVALINKSARKSAYFFFEKQPNVQSKTRIQYLLKGGSETITVTNIWFS